MKSRVITFCVLLICSELVASIPYPEELASLLRAYSTSGAPSNNDFSNPLELPSVARSHNYGDSVSIRDFSGTGTYEQGNSDYNYNPLEISNFQSSQNQGSSSTLNELYDRSRIQQRNSDYEKYIKQSQSSISELTLQRELEKQQQAALQNRLANQFIQTGGRNKYISNRDISSEISPPQIRRVSDSYVDSLPLETLLQHNLQQGKRVETMPIRSKNIQKPLPILNNQPSSLLDKLRPTHLNTRKSASQGYENIQQGVDPIVFSKQQYLQVPQGTSRKSVIDDARIKEILDEVEMANKVANSGYRDIVAGGINTKEVKTGMEKVFSQSKATGQAFATTSKEGGNQKYLPGSLTEIFSHLQLNKEKPGPIPKILNGSALVTHPSKTEPKKPNKVPGSLTDIFSHLNFNQSKPGPVREILNGSVSTARPSKTEPTKPKENNPKKKRYLIIHPNGTQEYVNALDGFVTHHTNYVLYTPNNVTQGVKVGHIPANNPYVHHTEVSANAISKATVALASKNINATKTVATNSVLPTKQKISPNETIINKVVIDGNLMKNSTVPKKVPVISPPSGSVSAAAAAAATATASVLPAKPVGLGLNKPLKPIIIKPRNPLLTAQSIAKVSVTLPHPKNLPQGKVNVSKPLYVSEIIIYEIDPLTMKPKIISDTVQEISKPNTTKPTNTTNPQTSSTSTTSTTQPTTTTSSTTLSTTTTSTTTQPTTTTSSTTPTTTTTTTTTQPTTTTSSTTPSTTTTSTTTQPTTTTSSTTPSTTTTSTTTQPTTTTSSTTPSTTTTSTTTQPTTTTSSTTPSTTTTSTTTQPTTTTSSTTPSTTTTSTTTQPTTTTSSTTPSTTTTSTTTQPTTTTSSTTPTTTTTSTTTQPTTTTSSTTSSTTTSTTTQPTTTTTTMRTRRTDHKEPRAPVWFETDLNDGGEDFLDKLTEGDDTPRSVYVFQIPVRPIIDRDTKTTIYPNGTIVEETIEAVWDDHTDKPKLVRATTIVHPKDKRNLSNEDNDDKNNKSDTS